VVVPTVIVVSIRDRMRGEIVSNLGKIEVIAEIVVACR
jgi:hypothetical protein